MEAAAALERQITAIGSRLRPGRQVFPLRPDFPGGQGGGEKMSEYQIGKDITNLESKIRNLNEQLEAVRDTATIASAIIEALVEALKASKVIEETEDGEYVITRRFASLLARHSK